MTVILIAVFFLNFIGVDANFISKPARTILSGVDITSSKRKLSKQLDFVIWVRLNVQKLKVSSRILILNRLNKLLVNDLVAFFFILAIQMDNYAEVLFFFIDR